jgi:GDP-L-fucose synthase
MIAVTGAGGFLGTAVCAHLRGAGYEIVPLLGRSICDLRDPLAFPKWLAGAAADIVVHLAYPGTDGIGTSLATPGDLAHEVLQIDLNVIRACAEAHVQKLICIGSVCAYPEQVTFPTTEDQLFAGPPEWVNAPYGHAKRMQLALLEAYHRQTGLPYTQLILSNLYGPGDHSGHVIPVTIRKVLAAQAQGSPSITVWGDGTASREFLYVRDAATAVARAIHAPALNDYVNICSGEEISIRALVTQVMAHVGYTGDLVWDPTKPNGQPRRQFSWRRAQQVLDWAPIYSFSTGLARTIAAMQEEA